MLQSINQVFFYVSTLLDQRFQSVCELACFTTGKLKSAVWGDRRLAETFKENGVSVDWITEQKNRKNKLSNTDLEVDYHAIGRSFEAFGSALVWTNDSHVF